MKENKSKGIPPSMASLVDALELARALEKTGRRGSPLPGVIRELENLVLLEYHPERKKRTQQACLALLEGFGESRRRCVGWARWCVAMSRRKAEGGGVSVVMF